MKLNKFLWDNFIHSKRGQEWKKIFQNLEGFYHKNNVSNLKGLLKSENLPEDFYDGIDSESEIDGVLDALQELKDTAKDGLIPKKVSSIQEADDLWLDIADLIREDEEGKEDDIFHFYDIPRLSIALHCLHPSYFFPYYFYLNFYTLRQIFDEFGIFLPAVPTKFDVNGRYHYYFELCKSLHSYWQQLGLPIEDIPVFLYAFAPAVIEFRKPQLEELPTPKRAWFVGGGINNNGDFEYLDKMEQFSTTHWQGNKETEAGDIVVMYCLSPRKYIHSIWRAIEPGSVEPFFSYYGAIRIGYPIHVEPIFLSEIKSDAILSTFPLVKGNMQGINGRNIPKNFYDQILYLLEKKGMASNLLPRLENKNWGHTKLKNERDVEINILEPLLRELGFDDSNWHRQVKLRVGRSEKVIPDYLLNLVKSPQTGLTRASWVWEAKLSIISNEQLGKDFGQVCSYARLVEANGVGLISKEGLWIGLRKDNFDIRKSMFWPASRLKEIDQLNEIRSFAGKRSK